MPTVGVQYLPRIIQEYAARYPDNRIKILDHASSGVADAVLRREAEFGIHIGGPHHPELASVPLLEDRFVLICRDDHPLAKRTRAAWRQLEPHPLIFAGEVERQPAAARRRARRAEPVAARASTRCSAARPRSGSSRKASRAAVVPSLAIQKGAYPRIRVVALMIPVVSRTLVLVARKTAHLSPAAQALYDMITRA